MTAEQHNGLVDLLAEHMYVSASSELMIDVVESKARWQVMRDRRAATYRDLIYKAQGFLESLRQLGYTITPPLPPPR
jgi:hypothetical protein